MADVRTKEFLDCIMSKKFLGSFGEAAVSLQVSL
jgi:hypothetical protein